MCYLDARKLRDDLLFERTRMIKENITTRYERVRTSVEFRFDECTHVLGRNRLSSGHDYPLDGKARQIRRIADAKCDETEKNKRPEYNQDACSAASRAQRFGLARWWARFARKASARRGRFAFTKINDSAG